MSQNKSCVASSQKPNQPLYEPKQYHISISNDISGTKWPS